MVKDLRIDAIYQLISECKKAFLTIWNHLFWLTVHEQSNKALF